MVQSSFMHRGRLWDKMQGGCIADIEEVCFNFQFANRIWLRNFLKLMKTLFLWITKL